MIRAFIAANLPVSVVEEMAKVQSFLREAQGDIRWVRPEGFHLTLKFLGNMHEAKVEPTLHVLRETLKIQPTLNSQLIPAHMAANMASGNGIPE